MNSIIKIKNIATVFLEEEINYSSLTKAIGEYKALLSELSNINLEEETARSNIHFETGKALGTTWAAMCVNDMIRTKMFVKGINAAVLLLQKKKKEPIHILYAGTGPYAALILPLLAIFTEKELQLTLLEINKASFDNMLSVMNALGFTKFIHTAEQTDASVYKIKNPSLINIMVTETMQHALVKEQQVPITINLMNQLSTETLLIPQNIILELALMDSEKFSTHLLNKNQADYYKLVGRIFELNTGSFVKFEKDVDAKIIFPEVSFELSKENMNDFDKLIILTTIQIFGNTYIKLNESGLTMPLIIEDISHKKSADSLIRLWYEINNVPGIRFELINKTITE